MIDTKHTKIQVTRTEDGSIRGEVINRAGCTLRVFFVPVEVSQEETVARVLDGLGFENSGQLPPMAPVPAPNGKEKSARDLLFELYRLVKHAEAGYPLLLTTSHENSIKKELQLNLTKEPQPWQSF